MSSSPVHTCLVSVVGFTAHGNTYQSSGAGVGKSCLCSRFCYGGVDEYVSDHPSIMALHEFESQVISTDHFIYWGPHTLTHTAKGSAKEVTVKYEVVEHTIFYHDETSQPFPNLRKLTVPRNYAKKVFLPPESSRKISYYARDAIGFPDKYRCMPYPSNPSRLLRGFLLAIDVSMKDYQFEYQLTAAETINFELRKNVVVVAATKRDIACPESMVRLNEWAYKQKLTVIETSSKEDVNVEDAFRVVAARLLARKAKINESFVDYAQGSGYRVHLRSQAKRDFKKTLKSFVLSSSVTMEKIETIPAYQSALRAIGKFVADEILFSHLLMVRNQELDSYIGTDDPEMRTEMLEDFIEGCPDFGPHKKTLYKLMNSIINPGQAVYVNETFAGLSDDDKSPRSPEKVPKSPEKYVRLVNQVYDDSPSQEESEDMVCDGGTSSSTSLLVEEVYDNFDGGEGGRQNQPHQDEVTKLTMLPIKDRASLLKTQLSGGSVQIHKFLQDNTQREVPPLASSTDSDVLSEIRKESPPSIPSKPKGYQKWKLAKREDAEPQYDNTEAQYDNTEAQYDNTEAQYDNTEAQYDNTEAQYDDTGSVLSVMSTSKISPQVSPPLVPTKPKGYQKWKPVKTDESPESTGDINTVTTKPQAPHSPQVPTKPKGYQKWKPVKTDELPESTGVTNTVTTKPQDPPSPPVPTKPKGYQKWKPVKTDEPPESTGVTNTVTTKPQTPSSPPVPTKPKGYQKWKPVKVEVTPTDTIESTDTTKTATTPDIPRKSYEKTQLKKNYEKKEIPVEPSPKPKRDDYKPMLPILREKQRQMAMSQGSGLYTNESSTPPVPIPSVVTSLPVTLASVIPTATSVPVPLASVTPIVTQPSVSPSSLAGMTPPSKHRLPPPPPDMEQQRPVSPNVTTSLTSSSHSTSLSSITQTSSQLSPTRSAASPSPPPIPPHTVQMLETPEPTTESSPDSPKKKNSASPTRRHNYFNTILKSFKRDKSKSIDAGNPVSPPKRTLVNMRNRSLPAEPYQRPPDHDADEYENPDDFISHRLPMPLPPDARPVHPSSSYSGPGFMEPYYDDPTVQDANPFLLNQAWIKNKRLEQGQPPLRSFRDDSAMLRLPGAGLPRRTQSFQVNYRLNTRAPFDDDVDEDGYQKTDEIDEIRQTRDLPRIPPSILAERRHSFEYDYPNLRGVRTFPRRNVLSPPRSDHHRPLVKEDSYVNMDLGGADDYQNSDIIKAMVDSVSPKRTPPRSSHGSMDDMSIYYNLRDRSGLFSPPRTPERSSWNPLIPPRLETTADPKPPPRPPVQTKKRSFTVDSPDVLDTLKKHTLQSEEELIDAETGQQKKKTITLPPRNILRPGFSAHEYTPIID